MPHLGLLPREGAWNGSIEKDDIIRSQARLDFRLHVSSGNLHVGHVFPNLVDGTPLGHLSLNAESPSLWDRLEPSIGQLINEGGFTRGGRPRDRVPVCLNPERSSQKIRV